MATTTATFAHEKTEAVLIANVDHVEHVNPTLPSDEHIVVAFEGGPELEFRWTLRLVLSIVGLCLGYNGAFFSLSLIGPILTYINADIGPDADYIWMATAWSMTAAVTVTLSGRMMDIFGRRWLMIGGNAFCVIGCIVAGTAHQVNTVIAGTTLIAIGCGPQLQATAAIAELVPKKTRPIVTGIVAGTLFIPGIFGTPIAYQIISTTTWRWGVWVTLIVDSATCIFLALVYFPPTFHQKHLIDGKTKWQQFLEFDFFGVALFTGSLISLLLGINWGGSTAHPWKSGSTIAPIVMGFLGLVAFFCYEVYMPLKSAFIPKKLLQDSRGFVAVICSIFVSGMLLYSLQILWPQFIASIYTTDLHRIGWAGMSFSGGTTTGATLLGLVISKIGNGRILFVFVVSGMTAFIASMAAMNQHTNPAAIALTACSGLFVGFVQLVSITMIVLRVDDDLIGVAVGLAGTARFVGGAIATAIYVAVLGNKVEETLPTFVAEAVLPLGFPEANLGALIEALFSGSEAAILAVPGVTLEVITAAADGIKSSYVAGFHLIFLISIAFGGGAIVAAACTRDFSDQLTDHLAVELNQGHLPHSEATGKEV